MPGKMKKILTVSLVFSALLTQTGCIASMATGIGWLYAAGVLVELGGEYGCQSKTCAQVVEVVSLVLDEKNPGRQDALNPLPLDASVARNLNTSVENLALYNDELADVLQANSYLEGQIAKLSSGKITDADLNQISARLGFSNGQDLTEVLKQEKLSTDQLGKFAQAQNVTPETARLYLKLRFGVNVL
jgi:hypothetical protein